MIKQKITEKEYQDFKVFLEKQTGIVLGHNKRYLVENRLISIIEKYKFHSFSELIFHVQQSNDKNIEIDVIDAMTTNETLWFRDKYPFEILKNKVFPEFGYLQRPLQVWSAACSSGQEPYSIAMSYLDFKQQNLLTASSGISILGTDISPRMIKIANQSTYKLMELNRGITQEYRNRYFIKSFADKLTLKDSVTQLVNFKVHNLKDSYSQFGKFDIIFCRNVLIYFSAATKVKILRQFTAALNPGGLLFLGSSESLTNLSNEFDMIISKPGIFYKKRH